MLSNSDGVKGKKGRCISYRFDTKGLKSNERQRGMK